MKYKFLLHDFFPKFKNALIGQFVGNGKGATLHFERTVLCIPRSTCSPEIGLASDGGIVAADTKKLLTGNHDASWLAPHTVSI